jgi:hypothetical protein
VHQDVRGLKKETEKHFDGVTARFETTDDRVRAVRLGVAKLEGPAGRPARRDHGAGRPNRRHPEAYGQRFLRVSTSDAVTIRTALLCSSAHVGMVLADFK